MTLSNRFDSVCAMVSIETAAAIAMALPEVTEGESRGNRTWNVGKTFFMWERPFSKADIKRFGAEPVPDGQIIGLRVADLGEKEAILAAGEKGFFTIPHFDGYSAVLVQLKAVTKHALTEAITDAWLATAPKATVAEFRGSARTDSFEPHSQ